MVHCPTCEMSLVPLHPATSRRRLGPVKAAVVGIGVLAFVLGLMAFVPWLSPLRKYLVVGMATCLGIAGSVAIGAHWVARQPITYRGPIYHSDRPVAYHLVSLVGFLFSLALAVVGLHAFFRSIVP
jgi:hypothetical protein